MNPLVKNSVFALFNMKKIIGILYVYTWWWIIYLIYHLCYLITIYYFRSWMLLSLVCQIVQPYRLPLLILRRVFGKVYRDCYSKCSSSWMHLPIYTGSLVSDPEIWSCSKFIFVLIYLFYTIH